MASESGSAAQFSHAQYSMGSWAEQANKGNVHVLPLMSGTDSSRGKATSWRIDRGPDQIPAPLDAYTAGSVRKWPDQK